MVKQNLTWIFASICSNWKSSVTLDAMANSLYRNKQTN
jgi:hypothetical protein